MRPGVGAVTVALVAMVASPWRDAAAQPRALLLGDGTRVGVALAGRPLPSWRPHATDAGRWETGYWGGRHRGGLVVTLGGEVAAPPAPSARAVVASQLSLATEAGAPFAEVYCAEVDVVRSVASGVVVRAYPAPGVVLEGVVEAAPRHVAWGNCAARATRDVAFPAHWRRADPGAAARVRLAGVVWWRDGGACQRWRFRRHPTGLRLERRERRRADGGVLEVYTHHNFEGTADDLSMYAAGGSQRWVRRPRGLHVALGGVGALGVVWGITFVQADARAMRWIVGGRGATAYHPADAQAWYRSRAACLAGA